MQVSSPRHLRFKAILRVALVSFEIIHVAYGQAWLQADDAEEHAEERRLLQSFVITWTPALDYTPAGGTVEVLYAGTNYTSWQITSDVPVTDEGRLVMVDSSIHYSGAQAGHCLSDLYLFADKFAPLDASIVIHGSGYTAEYNGGIIITQGGKMKLCWSPNGTFGIGDGFIVPQQTYEYHIYGATDTCTQGPGCISGRRFFCHLPHVDYLIYGPLGTKCEIFMQSTNTPLVYSRLTWTENATTGTMASAEFYAGMNNLPLRVIGMQCPGEGVGPAMYQSDKEWAREVDPLSRIDLGHVRVDQTRGFHYRICFCPSYDASIDGVCGELSDFVQQVGWLDGVMISFLSSAGEASGMVRSQVIAATRFTLRVDCGDGPWCGEPGLSRVKVIAKWWDAIETNVDLMFWDDRNGCEDAVEVPWWYSPPNCVNLTSKEKLSSHCLLSGGEDHYLQDFQDVRFLAKFDNLVPVAQIFDVCFVHLPLSIDGISPADYNRTSDDAMQNVTRTWWKVGQLVIEPLVLLNAYSYFVNLPSEVRVTPYHRNRTTTLYDHFPELNASGEGAAGPMLKVIQETAVTIDNKECARARPVKRDITGLICANASYCTPRAVKDGEDLVLNGGDPSHVITFARAGIWAVCYCEKWMEDQGACVNQAEWMLVGKMIVAGPVGGQDWFLDRGIIQSLEVIGYGFSDLDTLRDGRLGPMHTIRILAEGESDCTASSINNLATTFQVCSPLNKGRCQYNSVLNGVGLRDVNISDIPGEIWRYNSTYPHATIYHLGPDEQGQSIVKFTEIAVLSESDQIHFEDNIMPHATHWRRQADLDRILRGADHGYTILQLMDAGREARIPLSLNPYPPLTIDPPTGGRWWRSNKLRVPNIKGLNESMPHRVCWGFKYSEDDTSEYYMEAGYVTWVVPSFFLRADLGLTSNAAGVIAPIVLSFQTSDNSKYHESRNSMQLRVSFTNTSVLAPAETGINGQRLEHLYTADQPHEASQAVCGRLFMELYSEHEFGFPVPKGCWIDFNRYGAEGRVVAIYIIFEPLNGLETLTRYTIVMNALLVHAASNYQALSDDPGLIEITALDDILMKPEGVVDIVWVNPVRPIIEAARNGTAFPDSRFQDTEDFRGGVVVRGMARDQYRYDTTRPSDDLFLHVEGDTFGMTFLLKGDRVNPIRRDSIIRIFHWPLTLWKFNHRQTCEAECIPQDGFVCDETVACTYEAAQPLCEDVVPPKLPQWKDSRGRDCVHYETPGACLTDGTAWTPSNGFTAWDSCCVCGGGVRMNSQIVKLKLPTMMDAARGDAVIHTIRYYRLTPMPDRGFFATRFGAQVTDWNDTRPHYIVTSGRYIVKQPSASLYSPVATLVDAVGWGNEKMFKNDPDLNDYYLRLQLPASLYGTPWLGEGYLARIDIWLPVGFTCKMVVKAASRGVGDDQIELPVLPMQPPNGKGGIAESTTYEGGNVSTPGAGFRAGKWVFEQNKCSFNLERYMALFDKQRMYLHIYVKNPTYALPRNDPRNFWLVQFTSSGDSGQPSGYRTPCQPYAPPICEDTGEAFFVNPLGRPIASRSFELLYPSEKDVSQTIGPLSMGLPTNLTKEPNYTTSFAILGIIEDLVFQPLYLSPGDRNTLHIWFTPDAGNLFRGGYLGVHSPIGFDFGDPCTVRDLPHSYYSMYRPPYGMTGAAPWTPFVPRVFPVEDFGECHTASPPSWSRGGQYAVIKVYGSFLPGRRYGFEIDVVNPTYVNFSRGFGFLVPWTFKISITDDQGFGQDGTRTTGAFFPNTTHSLDEIPQAPPMYMASVTSPIVVWIDEMQPYALRPYFSRVEVDQIFLGMDVVGTFRVTAPLGYEWQIVDFKTSINGSDPMPGGVPRAKPDGRPNVIVWADNDTYLAATRYAFATFVKVPVAQPRASSNAFYFEWGYDGSGEEHVAAARTDAPPVRALRGLNFEMQNTNANASSRVWVWIETVSNISRNGTLEIQVPTPYYNMKVQNTTIEATPEGRFADYCNVHAVVEYGSAELPPDVLCRTVRYPDASLRWVLFFNVSGLPAGQYVLEFNVTNPNTTGTNVDQPGSYCGKQDCVSVYSKDMCGTVRPISYCNPWPMHTVDTATGQWKSAKSAVLEPRWKWENDYLTTVAAPAFTRPMLFVEIVNNTLDERLAVGRDDRPLRRSSIVIALMLKDYRATSVDDLNVRAPVGWLFDSVCDVWTAASKVYPPPLLGLPAEYVNKTTRIPVTEWPTAAQAIDCRGDGHHAVIRLKVGLQPQRLYMFRLGLKKNPIDTPWRRNTWSFTYGPESSGAVPGFNVMTFPFASLDPILQCWVDKDNPLAVPVGIRFNLTTNLYKQVMHGKMMLPMIRVIMPPLFEVVVDAESQDIQGGICYAILQEEGTCRLCGVPFHPDSIRCIREWNRKNVAMITLLNEDAWMYSGRTYKLYITLYNPAITNSYQLGPRVWVMESFMGQPVPFAEAPDGYALDYVEIQGFKISERAKLWIEVPLERNGSAEVDPVQVNMSFPEMLAPGDSIELRAPPGFNFATDVAFSFLGDIEIACRLFQWLPVVWPTDAEIEHAEKTGQGKLVRPPPRPPIPPELPPWARPQVWLRALPLVQIATVNMSNMSNTSNCSNDSESDTELALECNASFNESEELLADGLPEWALDTALEAQNASLLVAAGSAPVAFLVLKNHCLWNVTTFPTPGLLWKNVPPSANLSVTVQTKLLLNGTLTSNLSATIGKDNGTRVQTLCMSAAWIDPVQLQALTAQQAACLPSCNITTCIPPGVNCTTFTNATCVSACAFNMPIVRQDWCAVVDNATLPPNASVLAFQVDVGATCTSVCCSLLNQTNQTNQTNTSAGSPVVAARPCDACDPRGALSLSVLWTSRSDLAGDMAKWKAAYDAAVTLAHWDMYPLQAEPTCSDNFLTFRLTAENMHPERGLLNGTTFRSRVAFRNPTRPPLWFLNFWVVRHFQAGAAASSAAVVGWEVISKLRYIVMNLMTQVLKPQDPAIIHIEFVTVNPADQLRIVAVSPQYFNFEDAYIQSTPSETSDYGEYWRGFTKVTVGQRSALELTLLMTLDSVQYVRFRLGGIKIPFQGGQALFHLFTSVRALPQDEMQFCCPPGYPPNNPGVVFHVPYRFYNLYGSLTNKFMANPLVYPIASAMETRLDEDHRAKFTFFLPHEYTNSRGPLSEIAIVIRTPVAYAFLPDSKFMVQTVAGAGATAGGSAGIIDFVRVPNRIRQLNFTRAELLLVDTPVLKQNVEYRLSFDVHTPYKHAERTDRRLWIFEVTDRYSLEHDIAADSLGVYDDFILQAPINFTVAAVMSPPEVVIEVLVTLLDVGEINPNRVDVYAPSGYKFVLDCFAPGQKPILKPYFVSCRERWAIWNGNYLSGANMMAVDGGVNSTKLPVTVKLLAQTPAMTPMTNSWYVRAFNFEGLLAWGLSETAFPVNPMEVQVAYAATANTRVPLFLAFRLRVPLPYDGHVHLAAPRLYQLYCPVTKLLRGPMVPECTQTDPVLTGCWGLPSPDDPNPPPGLPICDPLHEVLLTFPRLDDPKRNTSGPYVMEVGDTLFLSLQARVPASTPTGVENVFMVRLLDESKSILDGKLNEFGQQVLDVPRLQDFKLWWTSATPDTVVTVALEFSFNRTAPRETELPDERLRVIFIEAPPGLSMMVKRPSDVIPLDPESPLQITEWNWTGRIPQGLWFGLDTTRNVTGRFYYSFPVLLPKEGQMPFNNLWNVRLCVDSPLCVKELLKAPIPGFFFGERPGFELSQAAYEALMGGDAWRKATPTATLYAASALLCFFPQLLLA